MVVLRLDSVLPAVLLAVSAVPLTVMGGQAGILQGERRWLPLGMVYLGMGVPRVVVGTLCLLVSPTETAAMLGVADRDVRPGAVGWSRPAPAPRRGRAQRGAHPAPGGPRGGDRNSLALLAFFVLSNADIVVARNVLDDHDAGLYAGGLILAKAVLFLPQFVVVVAFPSMSTVEERRLALLRSLGLVAALGVVATLGAWLLSGLAMVFVGGQEYADVQSRLWLFAVVGTLLAMLQLLVYSVLARQRHPVGVPGLAGGARAGRRGRHHGLAERTGARGHRGRRDPLHRIAGAEPAPPARPGLSPAPTRPRTSRRAGPDRPGRQCAASCQLRPVPTETSSGTVRSAAAPICSRTSASRASRSPGATSSTSSSWTCSSIRDASPASSIAALDVEHRDLDEVGGRALDRGVERHPLGHLAALAVVAGQVGQVAAAPHDGLGVARCAGPRRRSPPR